MTAEIDYTISEICEIVRGEWLAHCGEFRPAFLSLDSRRIVNPAQTVFWAISTESGDGSQFIKPLYEAGVRNFVTQKDIGANSLRAANIIRVNNTVEALQLLAAKHRRRFKHLHVIGITGSNGKTIVKEWLADILSSKKSVVKSPRSYNSQIGVALSLLQIRNEHRIGIFEAGISEPGEMQKLAAMIAPDTAILTNIGPAHDEGFASRRQKITEKLLLFAGATGMVYPGGNRAVVQAVGRMNISAKTKTISWCSGDCPLKIVAVKRIEEHSEIHIEFRGHPYSFTLPFTDEASVENAISCVGGLIASGNFSAAALKKFGGLHSVSMRLEMIAGINRTAVINDSYSNDLQSLHVALDFLKQQAHRKTTVILSDLPQTGLPSHELYTRVAQLLSRRKIDRLIGIGKEISFAKDRFAGIAEKFFFPSTEAFIRKFPAFHFSDEAILVKGARAFSFEKISHLLQMQSHQTVLSINLSNLAHNIRVYRSFLHPGTMLMAMVKAFAYGTGSEQISSVMQYIRADYLAVAYADEGVALREAGIELPVMVLNVDQSSFDNLVKYRLEPEIFSFQLMDQFQHYLTTRGITDFPVHIKIDTGMHRLGFEKPHLRKLLDALQSSHCLAVRSVFTHLSSSDNPAHDAFTKKQVLLFSEIADKIQSVIPYRILRHVANTSAISRFPDFQMDMVRLGIGMYGVDADPTVEDQLKTVNKLTTTISQIKKVKAGDVVGYGMQVIPDKKTIATVGIGYADGYPRLLGNGRGSMMIRGQLASTVGNICMDMTMLDISAIKGAGEGDEVLIFGESLSVNQVAAQAGTIPYEIFTGISQRVKRIYFEES